MGLREGIPMTFAGFNRRMRKTARPVVWKGYGVQLPVPPSDQFPIRTIRSIRSWAVRTKEARRLPRRQPRSILSATSPPCAQANHPASPILHRRC